MVIIYFIFINYSFEIGLPIGTGKYFFTFIGADIANVVNEAALHAATMKKPKVTGDDLEFAMEKVVGGTEKRTHVSIM